MIKIITLIKVIIIGLCCGWFCPAVDLSCDGGWTRIWQILSCGWLEFRQLVSSCGWLWPVGDSIFGSRIQVTTDSIMWLTPVLVVGLDLSLIYTFIYRSNLGTYFPKYIVFKVRFLAADFSYHWFRHYLVRQEPWRSLKELEKPWRSFEALAATDSSCSG